MPGSPQAPSLAESWSVSQGRARLRVRPAQGRAVPQRRPGHRRRREVLASSATGAPRPSCSRSGWRRWRRPTPRHVRFRLKQPWPDFMTFYTDATGAGWIVPQEVRGEGRRRGLQEGAGRRGALQVRLVHARASSWCSRPSTSTGASPRASSAWCSGSSRTSPRGWPRSSAARSTSPTRSAASWPRSCSRRPGSRSSRRSIQATVLALLRRPVGSEVAVARPARAPGRQPRHRPPGHQPGA